MTTTKQSKIQWETLEELVMLPLDRNLTRFIKRQNVIAKKAA